MATIRSRRQFVAGLAATAVFGTTRLAAQTAAERGFIFGPGPAGRCDDAKVGGPIVKWNPTERRWWMYYYCRDSAWPKDVAPAFGTGRVALAKSDDGVNWTRFDGPLAGGAVFAPSNLSGAFDTEHLASGDVLFHEGEWIMAYFGGDSTIPRELGGLPVPEGYQFKGYRGRPGIARSRDGVNWTRVAGGATGGAAVDIGDYIYAGFPNLIFDGRRFLLYYSMLHPRMFYWETHVAESQDLKTWNQLGEITWDTDPRPWELGGSVTRHIVANPVADGAKWLMTYSALDSRFRFYPRSVAAAESDDGIKWRRVGDAPILYKGTINSWDGAGVTFSYLVPVGDALHLYYYGFRDASSPSEPKLGIGVAVSQSGRPDEFTKYFAQG